MAQLRITVGIMPFLLCCVSVATDLTVPKQYANIQSAVDAASNGDRVLISAGTYRGYGNVEIDTLGKAISIIAVDGALNTSIDCRNQSRAFNFRSGESSSTKIQGLTIRNGKAALGGAIFIQDSSPRIVRCVLIDNSANRGGAVYADGGSPSFEVCTFRRNRALLGGGLFANNSNSTIVGTTFDHCSANETGGAIAANGGLVDVRSTVFRENRAELRGGAIHLFGAEGSLEDDVFSANGSHENGGAICAEFGSNLSIRNCTALGNLAVFGSGGVHTDPTSQASVLNSIFWGNDGAQISGVSDIQFCCVQGSPAGQGNVEGDPLVLDAIRHDYRLRAGSPCIDAGLRSSEQSLTDVAGSPRQEGFSTDIGAYEYRFDKLDALVWTDGENDLLVVPHDGNPDTDTVPIFLRATGFDWLAGGLTYRWSRDGELLSTEETLSTTVRAGIVEIRVDVAGENGVAGSNTTRMRVLAEPNQKPVAHAGDDVAARAEGSTGHVTLRGRGYDADGDPLTYRWSTGSVSQILELDLIVGKHEFTFTVADSYGATDSDSVVVTVTADAGPSITLSGPSDMAHEFGTPFSDPGATAETAGGAALEVTVTGTVNVNQLGTYTLTYTATDDSGRTVSVTRTVRVVDTVAPVITLNGSTTMDVAYGGTYSEPGATAVDNVDGSVTVTTSGSVNTNLVGVYQITYTAADGSGNSASKIRTVNVKDLAAPTISAITLNPSSLKTHPNGQYQTVNLSYSVSDNLDPSPTVSISVTSSDPDSGTGPKDNPVDIIIQDNNTVRLRRETSPPTLVRTYTITVTATDASGNVSTRSATITVSK